LKLLHLTDTHLVAPGQKLYGLDPNGRLDAAVADINTYHRDAACVLVTGDLAHTGGESAYGALKAALAKLSVPYHLLIGNHDNREVFRRIFPETAVDEDGFVQSVFETPAGPFVLLDTNEPDTHAGWLCARRLSWLDRTLTELAGRSVFLAMHHPPMPLHLPALDAIGLIQHRQLAEVVGRHDYIRHIFFGHAHRPVHGSWNGIPLSTQRALSHQVALEFDESSGIPGSHEPPAYSVVFIERDSVIVHVHDFLDASPRFNLFDVRAERATDPSELV
jgi:Icc protein